MPKRNPHNRKPSPLLDEIRSLEAFFPEDPMRDAESLCVLRVVSGLDGPAWTSLSQSHGLGQWCAVPLCSPTPRTEILAQAISQLSSDAASPGLRSFLRMEIERSRACDVPLALALIQPDRGAPDRADTALLYGLLDLVRGLKRSFDHAAVLNDGLGGELGRERLALVFSGASLSEAERLVGAILRRIRAQGAGTAPTATASLLCSAGLAGYGGCVELTPDELIASAELALADARSLGGNRLEVAAPVDVCLASRDTLVHANEKHFLFTGKKVGDK